MQCHTLDQSISKYTFVFCFACVCICLYAFTQPWRWRLKFCNSFPFQVFWPERFWMRAGDSERWDAFSFVHFLNRQFTHLDFFDPSKAIGEGLQHGCVRQFVHMKTASIRAHTQGVLYYSDVFQNPDFLCIVHCTLSTFCIMHCRLSTCDGHCSLWNTGRCE